MENKNITIGNKYQIGDKVRIKSIDWYNENKTKNGYVCLSTQVFIPEMSERCGMIVTIKDVFEDAKGNAVYFMKETDWIWTDEMIEGLVEEGNNMSNIDKLKRISTPAEENWFEIAEKWEKENNDVTQDDCSKAPKLTSQDYSNGRFGYQIPRGFTAKLTERELILTPEKPVYPKTYEECCKVLGVNSENFLSIRNVHCYDGEGEPTEYEIDLLDKFYSLWQLLICRTAYWKIAGEEIGLGKPWEPDWENDDHESYPAIVTCGGKIIKSSIYTHDNPFAFPTPEMRDAFKENFDADLEFCKELL